MNSSFTPEQNALADALSRLLERDGQIAVTRNFYRGEDTDAQSLAQKFRVFGGPAIMVPESFGGSGLSTIEAALVASAIGRHCSPLPYLGNVLASHAIVLAGTRPQQESWLPRIASGDCRVATCLRHAAGRSDHNPALRTHAPFVLDVPDCDAILLRDSDHGLRLMRQQPGVTWVDLITVDLSRRYADVHIESVESEALNVNAYDLQTLIGLERVLIAAETLGACDSLVHRALVHARERHQFGRSIGAFQAIKHLCADMTAELDLARSLVWHAAATHASGDEHAPLVCAQAKALMDETARMIGRGAIEIHGAMGFAEQSDLHFWSKRIAVNRTIAGTPEQIRREIAAKHGWVEYS